MKTHVGFPDLRMKASTSCAPCVLALSLIISAAYGISDLEVYPGRSLLHDHDGNKNDYGCQCKHADWYCHGYCNIGTTSGDTSGCMRDCLVCCGWGQAPPSSQKAPPAATPQPTAPAAPAADAASPDGSAAPSAPADTSSADTAANGPPAAATGPPAAATGPPAAATGPPTTLTKSSAVPAPVRVVTNGRRLQQHSKGSPSPPPSSPPPSSPSGDWKGDWHGDKKDDKKDSGKKDPNQCWNSFYSKYPWKTSR
ncbi:g4497 [Coccomyxa elongata]